MTKPKSTAALNPIPKTSPKPESKKRQYWRVKRKMTLKEQETAAAATLLLAQRQRQHRSHGSHYDAWEDLRRPSVRVCRCQCLRRARLLTGSPTLSIGGHSAVRIPDLAAVRADYVSARAVIRGHIAGDHVSDLNVTLVLLDATPGTDVPLIHSKAPRAVPTAVRGYAHHDHGRYRKLAQLIAFSVGRCL